VAKYRKKPVVVEAIQAKEGEMHRVPGVVRDCDLQAWTITTLNGKVTIEPGDWIITGVKGEHYPCAPDIFEATYELVEEG